MINHILPMTLLVWTGIGAAATNTPMDRATLRGLQGVKIVVEPPAPELQDAGLKADSLQAQIEDRLRNAHVAIHPDAREFLGLHLIAVREKKGAFALSVELDLYQSVALERDPTIKTATETWGTQSVILVWPKQLNEAASSALDDLITQFINAYRSANP